jgi:lipopolysaccharide/colanic/teichoic acid biosynthesis glycosyltransferase
MIKRAFDIACSATVLVVAAPAMTALAAVIAKRMGRPVLFRQPRPGKNEQIFHLYKFRTMTDERGPDGELLPDGQRLTALGRFMRATSLDELPQLFNVLKGDMSLVGPRPLFVRYLPFFTEEERMRHTVRPGITGWAQINGRNEVSWDKRLAYDVWYVKNQSFLLDLQILLKTVGLVLRRQGVVIDPMSVMLNLDEERAFKRAQS